jgi:cytochrome c oxidase cbb3-type subunit 1
VKLSAQLTRLPSGAPGTPFANSNSDGGATPPSRLTTANPTLVNPLPNASASSPSLPHPAHIPSPPSLLRETNSAARFASFARAIQLHSLFWLVAANLVGLLLATELLYPAIGDALAPLTYGRWMPLHLDWQLYGWCSLPLVGALVAWFSPPSPFDLRPSAFPPSLVTGHWSLATPQRALRTALALWSIALAAGGLSWLLGETSGKLFLDWHGWARPLLPLAMSVLWTVLASLAWWHHTRFSRTGLTARIAFLLVLLAIPAALYWSAGDDVYPSVNPDSGGATGASLLGSTLGIIAIFGLLPAFLGIRATNTHRSAHRAFWAFFAFSCAAFAAIDHGHASHHAAGQIIGLAVLLGWLPLTWIYFRRFDWTPATRPWLVAAFGWWTLLVITGLITFLPGYSEQFKFTHGLVAHAHLAMAGLVTSVHVAILNELRPARPLRTGFVLWQSACALYVTAMLILGSQESAHAAELFRSESWTQALLTLRLLAGLAMTAASLRWLREAFRPAPATQ